MPTTIFSYPTLTRMHKKGKIDMLLYEFKEWTDQKLGVALTCIYRQLWLKLYRLFTVHKKMTRSMIPAATRVKGSHVFRNALKLQWKNNSTVIKNE